MGFRIRQLVPTSSFYRYLLAITAVGGYLRLWRLGNTPLWLDELSTWMHALGMYTGAADTWLPVEMSFLSMYLLGDTSNFAVRLPFAVASTIAIYFIGLTGRKLGGDKVGWVAAALVALSPFLVGWGTQARPYGLYALGVGVLLWAYLELLENRTRRDWWVFFGAAMFCCHTHVNSAQLMLGLGIWFLFSIRLEQAAGRRDLLRFLGVGAVAVGSSLFLTFWIQRPGPGISGLLQFSFPQSRYFWRSVLAFSPRPMAFEIDMIVLTGLVLALAWGMAFLPRDDRSRRTNVWGLASVAVLGLAITALCIGPFHIQWQWTRYITHSVIIGYLVAALGLVRIQGRFPAVAAGLVGIVLASYLRYPLGSPGNQMDEETQRILTSRPDMLPTDVKGVLLVGSNRRLAGFGRHFRDRHPVYFVHHAISPERFVIYGTERRVSRGGLTDLLTTSGGEVFAPREPDPHPITPGRYLLFARKPRSVCETSFKGTVEIVPGAYSIIVCDVSIGGQSFAAGFPRHEVF